MTSVETVAYNAISEYRKILRDYDPNIEFKKRLALYKEFCEQLFAVGNAAALLENDIDNFKKNMIRTAENGKAFLLDSVERGYVVPAYYNKPLLAAIVVDRHDLALEIARLSSKKKARWEYDDEFYFALFIQEYLISILDSTYQPIDFKGVCNNIEYYLESNPPKLQFFRALIDNNEPLAIKTFSDWNIQYAESIENKQLNDRGSYWDIVNDRIWTEGLAMLLLAGLNNIHLGGAYKYIPKALRSLSAAPDQHDVMLIRAK